MTLHATTRFELNVGTIRKEIFEDIAAFTPVKRPATATARNLLGHLHRFHLDTHKPILHVAMWAVEANIRQPHRERLLIARDSWTDDIMVERPPHLRALVTQSERAGELIKQQRSFPRPLTKTP
jgi:hypothetical protein